MRIDGFASSSMRNNFDLAPFESVTVVEGPSSMLYRQGSVGGFIDMVRKKPLEEAQGSVSAQVGSYDTRRVEGDVTGPIRGDGAAKRKRA